MQCLAFWTSCLMVGRLRVVDSRLSWSLVSLHCCVASLDKKRCSASSFFTQAPVVQRADNVIDWIGCYLAGEMCARFSR